MYSVIYILAVIAALLAVASGLWVATALLGALAARNSRTQPRPEHDSNDKQYTDLN